MSSIVHESLGRFPVVVRPKKPLEKPRGSYTRTAADTETLGAKNELPDVSEMRNVLLLAAYPIESSDSSWIVDTADSILRRMPASADKYKIALTSLSKEEVTARFDRFTKSSRYQLFVEANCRSACRKPYWTAEEAAFYSFGVEFPEAYGLNVIQQELEFAVHGKAIEGAKRPRPNILNIPEEYRFLAHILDRLEFIQRAIDIKELPEKIKPGQFIRWAERQGMSLPYKLMSGAKDVSTEILDWQDRYEAVQRFLLQNNEKFEQFRTEKLNENDELKREIRRLEKRIEGLISNSDDEKVIRIDAQQNMQTVLICMAREKYDWDKSNDAAAKQISEATADVIDGGLSPDTIKRQLKKAKDYVDGVKRRKSS